MDMVKLKVKYEVYRRYEPGPIVVGIINAPTLRSALLALADEVSMYNNKADILDQEEQKRSDIYRRRIIRHTLVCKRRRL